MRAEWLKRITPGWDWLWIDTDVPMRRSARIWQSVAFRYQTGPATKRINHLIRSQSEGRVFDLMWVDKAVFIRP
jgi:hypothetical protein